MAKVEHLLLLFEHPQEPAFMPKGPNHEAFNIPNEYLEDRYKAYGIQINSRFASDTKNKIPVKHISIPPLGEILDLPRESNFSLFVPKHKEIAAKLIALFMGMRDYEDLMSMALYARDRVNPYLFQYAFSVAILHREDTKHLEIPPIVETFPDKFTEPSVFLKARKEGTIVPEGSRTPVEIPVDYTASHMEEEQRVAYFREDIGVNLHHWHWHLVYPVGGGERIVKKDRRGELFYYMHQQIIARYNFERLANNLARVKRFTEWREEIKEGYFPKMDSAVASRAYPARMANQKLKDVKRVADKVQVDIRDLENWRDRISSAIQRGYVENTKGEKILLDETKGIDVLGDIVEASELSPNMSFYGNLHNMGHNLISYIHDPDHRFLEDFGVMGDVTTAMRDPIFYRWHTYIDSIFRNHKEKLTPYTEEQLDFDGITVTDISVSTASTTSTADKGDFNTFWQLSDIDLSSGMDFQNTGAVPIRYTHLQHLPFTYNIKVNNKSKANKKGTCRIFLAPAKDERNYDWTYTEQRVMFIELDKFTVDLKQGEQTIPRSSTQSSVTIPFERTFRDLYSKRPKKEDTGNLAQFNFCGCGWPHHMLIPRGTTDKMSAQLFVMISDYEGDKVVQDTSGVCNDAGSYCGIRDKLYPDKRAMGYPFDRLPRDGVKSLQQFLTPNMRVKNVTIKHHNRKMKPKQKF